MSWKDNLRPASFRGASFKVERHRTGTGARRTALHEYPGRDVPLAEDLGRKAQQVTVEAYVVGDDYMTQRDALIEACGKAGAGALIHPYLGQMQMICTECTLEESTADGRIARFQLAFVQAGENRLPGQSVDTAVKVNQAADLAATATSTSFGQTFDASGLPEFAEASSRSLLSSAMTAVGDAIGAALPQAARSVLGSLSSLAPGGISDPAAIADKVIQSVTSAASGLLPAAAIDALDSVAGFAPEMVTSPFQTATRLRETGNREAVATMFRRGVVIAQSRLAPQAALASSQETIALRDKLGARLDTVMTEATADDDVFQAFDGLRAAVVKDLNARAPSRANLLSVPVRVTEPGLVAAYRLYGDASAADELLARNAVRHPGFLIGGQSIEALSDV